MYFLNLGCSSGALNKLEMAGWICLNQEACIDYYLARALALNLISKKGFDLCTFIDLDDLCDSERIRKVKSGFSSNPDSVFSLSTLRNFDNEDDFFKFEIPYLIKDPNLIVGRNIIGLGAASFNLRYVDLLSQIIIGSRGVVALDWYVFYVLLRYGLYGHRDFGRVCYRIYENNMSISTDATPFKDIWEREKRVKMAHFKILSKQFEEFTYSYDLCKEISFKITDEVNMLNFDQDFVREKGWWSRINLDLEEQ